MACKLNQIQTFVKSLSSGLSGRPLKELSTSVIRKIYKFTGGAIPIIGVGGIADGRDCYEKIRAGASAVQVYSMLTYRGLGMVRRAKLELQELLEADGFESVEQAVGAEFKVKQTENS